MLHRFPPLTAALLGLLLALTLPPLRAGVLTPVALAGVLWFAVLGTGPRQVAARLWWSVATMTAVHLFWLTAFLGQIFQFPPAGVLALALYALEGGFFAFMGLVVSRLTPLPERRVWGLAGGWVVVEFLRFLGPLAFPWPTLGYSLLPTPLIQIADLGGVLLVSVLVAALAAALAQMALQPARWRVLVGPVLIGPGAAALLALGYGLTRHPADGPLQPMRVLRVNFDAFGRASGQLTRSEQVAEQLRVSTIRPAGSVAVWSETALTSLGTEPTLIPATPLPDSPAPLAFPGPGISGIGLTPTPDEPLFRNAALAIGDQGQVTGLNVKAKLVPFGEYFPLYTAAPFLYRPIERAIGLTLEVYRPAQHVVPLSLNGVKYGAYICYDSVFPWVARTLAREGAEILVNPSNDGWYQGWGVAQHFWMGRVRAIETRRWLVRSVNQGYAGAVNDLGEPVQVISSGNQTQALDVQPRRLTGQTLYTRVGDWPALGLALLMGLLPVLWPLTPQPRSAPAGVAAADVNARRQRPSDENPGTRSEE